MILSAVYDDPIPYFIPFSHYPYPYPYPLLQEYASSGWEMPSAVNTTESVDKTDVDKDNNNGSSGEGTTTVSPSPAFFKTW